MLIFRGFSFASPQNHFCHASFMEGLSYNLGESVDFSKAPLNDRCSEMRASTALAVFSMSRMCADRAARSGSFWVGTTTTHVSDLTRVPTYTLTHSRSFTAPDSATHVSSHTPVTRNTPYLLPILGRFADASLTRLRCSRYYGSLRKYQSTTHQTESSPLPRTPTSCKTLLTHHTTKLQR